MATSLKHTQLAEKGEGVHSENVQEQISNMVVNDHFEDNKEVHQEYFIFKLVDTKKKGGVYIPNIDDVINPDTNNVERIRLLSGVPSIWVKDQKDLTSDYVRSNSRSLSFPRNTKCLRIPSWDKTALDFARLCRHNIGAPNRKTGSRFEFFEYNPAKQAEEALNRELLEIDMATLASELTVEQTKKYLIFLKQPLTDEVGELKQDKSLKRDLMLFAKRNPIEFQKIVNHKSKEVEIGYLVKKLVGANKIDISTKPGRAFWADGGGLIGVIPKGKDARDYLTDLALTNSEDGRNFQEQLSTLL